MAAARDPYIFERLGVPDTLDGRFDLVGLHVFLVIRRLQALPPPGPALAQAVFDAMFSDMDVNLREMGVSDLSVGKRVRAMWEAFHGRSRVYDSALTEGDELALATALERNVWRGQPVASGAGRALTRYVVTQDGYLAAQSPERLMAGQVDFLPFAPSRAA